MATYAFSLGTLLRPRCHFESRHSDAQMDAPRSTLSLNSRDPSSRFASETARQHTLYRTQCTFLRTHAHKLKVDAIEARASRSPSKERGANAKRASSLTRSFLLALLAPSAPPATSARMALVRAIRGSGEVDLLIINIYALVSRPPKAKDCRVSRGGGQEEPTRSTEIFSQNPAARIGITLASHLFFLRCIRSRAMYL